MSEETKDVQNVNAARRVFLKSLLAGSALIVLESFNKNTIVSALAATSNQNANFPKFSAIYSPGMGYPQSVVSGDPTDSGAILWTRVDPSIAAGISGTQYDPGLVKWMQQPASQVNSSVKDAIEAGQFVMFEVSQTEDFSNPVLTGFAPIWKDFDNIVKVDVDGFLQPRIQYYYRFITKSGYVSRTGRFKTLPAAGADTTNVKFAYVSCDDYTNGYYNALRFLANEDLDFVVHLGDYVYESVGDPNYQNPLPDRQINLPSNQSKAFTIDDYRTIYRTYRSDADLQKMHENHAMIAIWDDHEFANDCYYPAIAPDDSPNSSPSRRLTANQVWFEYMPARVTFDANKGFEDSIQIYRNVKIGNLAELIMTDERLYRSSHPCGEGLVDERYFTSGCDKMNDPMQTMLGTGVSSQKEWFLSTLKRSTAVWKIWGNEVQYTPLMLLGKYLNLDAWDGFAWERQSITNELKTAGIRNFLAITGDLHTFEASLIKSDYQNDADSEAVGVEFMVGSVTSSNLKEMLEQALIGRLSNSDPIPPSIMKKITGQLLGPFTELTESMINTVIDQLSNVVLMENPWIKLFNSSTHGYSILELTKNKATWTAYTVSTIKSKQASKSLLWQCEVPRDEAAINIIKG